MLNRTGVLTVLLLVCGGLAVLGVSASASTAQRAAKAFTIRSSLDGKTVLPHRIRWIAYASAPVLFPGVEFLIDGKLVFANRLEPYAFADDGRDEESGTRKTGYLVTSWLAPGAHRFTVRGKAIVAGRRTTAEKTVTARVTAPPSPPAQLAGTWERQLDTAVPPDPNRLYRGVTAQPGTYRIVIERRYLRLSGPAPRKHVKVDYVADPRTLTIRGAVWTGDPDEGAVCDPWGPDATYTWSVSEDTLTLEPAARPDACKQRGAITGGEWTRAG
jgi:hypothetical protein